MKEKNLGILFMIGCATLWSISGVFIKLLPWHGLAVASLRSLIATLTIAAYIAYKQIPLTINQVTVLTGVLTGIGTVCIATANKLTTAANVTVLQFTTPIFVLLFSVSFLSIKIRIQDCIAVLLVMGGIILCFLDQLAFNSLLGNLLAVLAGLLMAIMYIMLDGIQLKERYSSMLICQAIAFLIGLPAVFITKPVFNTTSITSIFILGVFQLGIAYILFVKASRTCPAFTRSLLSAIEPLLNPVWVALVIGEIPGTLALIGGSIVIAAVTFWCIWNEKQIVSS